MGNDGPEASDAAKEEIRKTRAIAEVHIGKAFWDGG
jgi:hypothetical protein